MFIASDNTIFSYSDIPEPPTKEYYLDVFRNWPYLEQAPMNF
jgi:hypothetical protein